MSQPTPSTPIPTTNSAARKPRVSIAIATAFGLGYLPKAPGTWGSLGGVALAIFPFWVKLIIPGVMVFYPSFPVDSFVYLQCWFAVLVALFGVWAANRAAKYWDVKDPQKVVIDEVSGQQLAYLVGGFWPARAMPGNNAWNILQANHAILWGNHPLGITMMVSVNWKYLLLGFILFRVFDIWKPFPARQAEALPGGWGIMADDWIAGIYAALGLWVARAIGL